MTKKYQMRENEVCCRGFSVVKHYTHILHCFNLLNDTEKEENNVIVTLCYGFSKRTSAFFFIKINTVKVLLFILLLVSSKYYNNYTWWQQFKDSAMS